MDNMLMQAAREALVSDFGPISTTVPAPYTQSEEYCTQSLRGVGLVWPCLDFQYTPLCTQSDEGREPQTIFQRLQRSAERRLFRGYPEGEAPRGRVRNGDGTNGPPRIKPDALATLRAAQWTLCDDQPGGGHLFSGARNIGAACRYLADSVLRLLCYQP